MEGQILMDHQRASGEELRPLFGRTLMTMILDKAFRVKGERISEAPRNKVVEKLIKLRGQQRNNS